MKGKTTFRYKQRLKTKMRICKRCSNTYRSPSRRGAICPKCEKPKGTPKNARDGLKMRK